MGSGKCIPSSERATCVLTTDPSLHSLHYDVKGILCRNSLRQILEGFDFKI